MTEMFGEAWPPMSVPDLAPDDNDDILFPRPNFLYEKYKKREGGLAQHLCNVTLLHFFFF